MKFINYIEKVSGVDILGLLSLLVFFLFFIGMLVWVFKTKKKILMKSAAYHWTMIIYQLNNDYSYAKQI